MSADRPAIVVHGRADVALAARLAAGLRIPIMLLTAPGAADYAGPDVLLAMVRAGLAEAPDADVETVIDCADAPGWVLAALRAGWTHVLFTGPVDMAVRLGEIARRSGALILADRPKAHDTGGTPLTEGDARRWLVERKP